MHLLKSFALPCLITLDVYRSKKNQQVLVLRPLAWDISVSKFNYSNSSYYSSRLFSRCHDKCFQKAKWRKAEKGGLKPAPVISTWNLSKAVR